MGLIVGSGGIALIDYIRSRRDSRSVGLPTQGSYDGGHPTMYGQAVFGAGVAIETQRILNTANLDLAR